MKPCAISMTRRRSKLSAIAPAASENSMIGSVVEACTSATMLAEAAIVVIIQAAPTAWISPPKFEARVASQIARNVGFLSGASAEARGFAAVSMARAIPPPRSCPSAPRGQPAILLKHRRAIAGALRTLPLSPGRDRFAALHSEGKSHERPEGQRRNASPHRGTRPALRQHCRHRGGYPLRPDQPPRAGRRHHLRQVRVLQSGRFGQGPPRAQHHRGGRTRRHAEARPDRGRGDQRQHRHRPRHGLRRQGLPIGGDHGRQLLRRAAPAHALLRRQGDPDAAGAEGLRHVHEGQGARRQERLVPGAPVRDRRQRRHPRVLRRPPRSSATSRASDWTTSSRATAPAARSRVSVGS